MGAWTTTCPHLLKTPRNRRRDPCRPLLRIFTREELEATALTSPLALVDIILALQAQVQELLARVSTLEAQVAKNSRNSSKPPSSDGYGKPRPKSLHPPTDRKPGGQKGHPGQTLSLVETPDRIVVHEPERCLCGYSGPFEEEADLPVPGRQVLDIPPQRLMATEHRCPVRRCPRCRKTVQVPFPAEAAVPVGYGPHFKGWLTYAHVHQLIPLARLSQMCQDLFGAPVSPATIQNVIVDADQSLDAFSQALEQELLAAPLAHADETGIRVDRSLAWLHVLSTPTLTWYGVHAHRGGIALSEFDLLPRFRGRLIHDCWAPYFAYDIPHGLCNAHLCRELVFVEEVLGQAWARPLRLFLEDALSAAYIHRERQTAFSPEELSLLSARYDELIAQGWAENPLPDPGPKRRGRPKRSKAQNLLFRMEHHKESILAFTGKRECSGLSGKTGSGSPGGNEGGSEKGFGEGAQNVLSVLHRGGDVRADLGEPLGPRKGAKAAGDLLFDLEHAKVAFGQVVGEGDTEVDHEGEDTI